MEEKLTNKLLPSFHNPSRSIIPQLLVCILESIIKMLLNIPTILHNLFPSRGNSSASIIIGEPSDMDVLCGRDRNFAKHPGNLLYRQLVERQASAYALALTKPAKMKITKSIVHTMQTQHGSRFLRRTEASVWETLTNIQARDKTSHALRFINNNNSSNSSNRTDDECEKTDSSNSLQAKTCPCHQIKLSDPSASVENNVDEAIAAIHQRQQELLRASMQIDQAMDVHGGPPVPAHQLMEGPLFAMSGATDLMSVSRSVAGGSELMYYVDDHHIMYDNDVKFDTIRSQELREILSMPVEDTLRSEELNYLMNEDMDE